MAAQLGAVGIAVDVRTFEFGTFFNDVKQGNFQLASMQTAAITEPDFLYTYFHSSRIPSPADMNAGNRWRYKSTELDQLTERGRREMDTDERQRVHGEAQAILARDLPIIPLWHEDVIAVVNSTVEGYYVLPSARFPGLATARKRPID
jgi:peptide/nickel transport system substrate-binding protein